MAAKKETKVSRKPNESEPNGNSEEPNDEQEFSEEINRSKLSVLCICPRCGSKHHMHLLWTGRGTPRKYCMFCKKRIANITGTYHYDVSSAFYRESEI